MKVVCVNDKVNGKVVQIKKGNMYTVIDTHEFTSGFNSKGIQMMDGVFYKLIETGHWYHNSLFIEINENQIDETELLEQRQEQLQTI